MEIANEMKRIIQNGSVWPIGRYRFDRRLIEMVPRNMIDQRVSWSRDSLLILLIKNTHFFERSNRWIINLETTISNVRKNAQKLFCNITMGIEGCSYILFTGNDLTIWNTSLSVWTTHNIVLIRQLVDRKFMGALIVDPENSLSLIIVVVVVVAVVFSRHWLLSWFAWFIIIMVTTFEILGDRLSIVIMFERSSMVCRSRIKYQIVWEDRVDDFLFSRLTTVQRSRMGRSRELQLWKRKNTKKKRKNSKYCEIS